MKDNNISDEIISSIAVNSPLYGKKSLREAIGSNMQGYWDADEMKSLIDKKLTSSNQ